MLGFLMFSGESKENVEKERVKSELKDSHPVKFFKNEEYSLFAARKESVLFSSSYEKRCSGTSKSAASI